MFPFCLDTVTIYLSPDTHDTEIGVMTKFQRWRLKNEMLVANFLANFIGAVVVQKLIVKGDVINEMTEGLKERDRMRQSLSLAMDVQQHLLPQSDPEIKGLDIAGESIYCEEIGGDYYDYLEDDKNGQTNCQLLEQETDGSESRSGVEQFRSIFGRQQE